MEHSNKNRFITIGLMLFALFFGAGNLIFPAAMGQVAGENLGWALLGFCITGVGLPLLGVMAIGYSGCHDLHQVANRVHPMFGIFYTIVCYMAIGPCFAVPRTGTVSFEIVPRCGICRHCAPDFPCGLFCHCFLAFGFALQNRGPRR